MQEHALIYAAWMAQLLTIALTLWLPARATPPWTRLPALLLGVAALLFLFWPLFALQRHGRIPPGGSTMETTQVVARGPFALLRHPQYFGAMLVCGVMALLNPAPLVLLGAATAVALFYAYAVQEEGRLLARFGAAYAAYMARVPRFNPLLRPRRPQSES